MSEKMQLPYSSEEKQRIVQSLRAVCVAQAELWDVLHEIENDHECSIETDIYLVGELAGGCNHPPSFADLKDDEVWESFEEHSEVFS